MNRLCLSAMVLALVAIPACCTFTLTDIGKNGVAFDKMTCNVQTIMDFKFNSSTISESWAANGTGTVVLIGILR